MKVLPYIEVVGNIHRENMGKYISTDEVVEIGSKIFKLYKFYSQPFEMGMLMNPIKTPDIKSVSPNGIKLIDKWQEAENKKLFKFPNTKGISNFSVVEKIEGLIANNIPETLNDFITYCKPIIKLHWKQSIVDKYFNHKTK